MEQLRICHTLNYAENGGTTGMIVSLMQRSKHKHTYVTYKATEYRKKQFKELNLELVELGDNNFDGAVAYMKEHADIVHAQFSGGPEPGVSIGLAANKPVIETVQSPNLPQGSMHETVSVVPVSKGITDYWPEDLRYRQVIYSCAEPIFKLDKRKCKQELGLDPDKPVVGRLGRLEGLKRPADFVHAATNIHARNLDVQFIIAGDGNDRDGVAGMVVGAKNVQGLNILMPGFVTGEEKMKVYNAFDVMLYPTSMEGFGIVFAEAMSLGIPIVTYSDPVNVDICGSAAVYAVDNLYATVINPFESIANLTLDLLENERERNKLSEYGKRIYKERFTPNRMAKEYDTLYENIIMEQDTSLHTRKVYI